MFLINLLRCFSSEEKNKWFSKNADSHYSPGLIENSRELNYEVSILQECNKNLSSGGIRTLKSSLLLEKWNNSLKKKENLFQHCCSYHWLSQKLYEPVEKINNILFTSYNAIKQLFMGKTRNVNKSFKVAFPSVTIMPSD